MHIVNYLQKCLQINEVFVVKHTFKSLCITVTLLFRRILLVILEDSVIFFPINLAVL